MKSGPKLLGMTVLGPFTCFGSTPPLHCAQPKCLSTGRSKVGRAPKNSVPRRKTPWPQQEDLELKGARVKLARQLQFFAVKLVRKKESCGGSAVLPRLSCAARSTYNFNCSIISTVRFDYSDMLPEHAYCLWGPWTLARADCCGVTGSHFVLLPP